MKDKFWPCPSFGDNTAGVRITRKGQFILDGIGVPFDTRQQAYELAYALKQAADYMSAEEAKG